MLRIAVGAAVRAVARPVGSPRRRDAARRQCWFSPSRAVWLRAPLLAGAFMFAVSPANVAAQTPTVTLTASPATIGEVDGSADVTVTAALSAPRMSTTTVTLSLGGTASDPANYQVLGSLLDDTLYEGDETIELEGSSGGADVVPGSITVEDDDVQPTITLNRNGFAEVHEVGDPNRRTKSVGVTARLLGNASFSQDTTFTLELYGPAENGVDFTISPYPFTITIPAGATTAMSSAQVTAVEDSVIDSGLYESIYVAGVGTDHLGQNIEFSYPGVSPRVQLGFVVDNDALPLLSIREIQTITLYEGDAAAARTVHVDLPAPATNEVTVQLVISGPRSRFSVDPAVPTIRIPAGESSGMATITITPISNNVLQRTGAVSVTAHAAGYGSSLLNNVLYLSDPLTQAISTRVLLQGNPRETSSATLLRGQELSAVLQLNLRNLDMVGTPSLNLGIGGSSRSAPCALLGDDLRCIHIVATGEYAPGGVEVPSMLDVAGVTFRDRQTNQPVPFNPALPAPNVGTWRRIVVHDGEMWSFKLTTSLESAGGSGCAAGCGYRDDRVGTSTDDGRNPASCAGRQDDNERRLLGDRDAADHHSRGGACRLHDPRRHGAR